MSGLRLYCVQGHERGKTFELEDNHHYILGRDPGDDGIIISDILASRHHIRIELKNRQVEAMDLGSANGTRINGKRMTDSAPLFPGDILTLGHTSLTLEDDRHSASPNKRKEQIVHQHRSSQRLRMHYDTRKTMQLKPQNPGGPESGNEYLLTILVGTLPLAVAIFDQQFNVLLTNDSMKRLCHIGVSAGLAGDTLVQGLANNLRSPQDLYNLVKSASERVVHLETSEHRIWNAWCKQLDGMTCLYLQT